MEEYQRLLQEIARKEQEVALLKTQLQRICPHPKINRAEYFNDDWAQNKTHVLVFRCATCGLAARMTKDEFDASGGSPFPGAPPKNNP